MTACTKMEGAGNDYIYDNGTRSRWMIRRLEREDEPAALAAVQDGLILILQQRWVRISACACSTAIQRKRWGGVGIRCVANVATTGADRSNRSLRWNPAGKSSCSGSRWPPDGTTQSVRVDSGAPQLDGAKIPSPPWGARSSDMRCGPGTYLRASPLVNMGNRMPCGTASDPDTASVTTRTVGAGTSCGLSGAHQCGIRKG